MDRTGSLSIFAEDRFIPAKMPPADIQFIYNILCSVLTKRSAWTTLKALWQGVCIPDNYKYIGCKGLFRPFLVKISIS